MIQRTPSTVISRHGSLALLAATVAISLPFGTVNATVGDISNPVTNEDITPNMDGGTTSTDYYYLVTASLDFSSYAVYLGVQSCKNHLTIENGGSLNRSQVSYIGTGTTTDATKGCDNIALVTGTGSMWRTSTNFYVGYYGSNNSLTLSDGGSVTGTYFYVGCGYENAAGSAFGSNNSVLVTGATTTIETVGFLSIGRSGSNNSLEIADGANVSTLAGYIGYGSSVSSSLGQDNSILVTGTGTMWTLTDGLDIGDWGSGNTVTVDSGALISMGDSITIDTTSGTNNYIRLSGGYIALAGDKRTAVNALIAKGYFKVWDSTKLTWVAGTSSNIGVSYYNAASASAAQTATGYSGLGDTTIIKAGTGQSLQDLTWADAAASTTGWYSSSWYGVFYTDKTFGSWIWSEVHGWQYIYEVSSTEIALWDCGTGDWWYTSKADYPWMYCYTLGTWYKYVSGSSPSRVFYDYATKANVNESSL